MASTPGLFTQWPWKKLGNFKYVILLPWVARSIHSYMTKAEEERDLSNFLIFPYLLWRWIHNQLWISFSRFQTARTKHLIVNKGIEFEQVDREMNWDDQILLNGVAFYLFSEYYSRAKQLPLWRADGIVMMILLHAGPVEYLYYWLHRALHHHFLYNRYHSHHHTSVATEPITSVIHPFPEIFAYFVLFSIPQLTTTINGTASIIGIAGYITYIDFMNNMGHCNFEFVPNWLFHIFPPLKYFMYTASFHSLHHTQFRTNYCLFMPIYDYIYGTEDKSTDSLYKATNMGTKVVADVVHLTHPTTLDSIFYLRLGLPSLASRPYSSSKWYIWLLMWPFTVASMFLTWVIGSTFIVESCRLGKLKMQTWAIPRYNFQYLLSWQRSSINNLIEEAILGAEEEGIKVISLGLLNVSEELNGNGELYLQKHPKLKIRVVDGISLAVAVVLNSIPSGTDQVVMRGCNSKAAWAIAQALCNKGVKIITIYRDEFEMLKLQLPAKFGSLLSLCSSSDAKVWLVGDGLKDNEQKKATKDAHFIPFSKFPPKKIRKDCVYYTTPALRAPKDLENMHSCENWLPRRVMSAWRVAGIVHTLEGWDTHACGSRIFDIDKIWDAALRHGFLPLSHV